MNKVIFFLLAVMLVYQQDEYKEPTIREILNRSEDQINIGEAALVLAKDFYPKLNIPYFLGTFDYLAKRFVAFLIEVSI